MFSKSPKNTSEFYWTEHVKFKMRFYGLSAQKILGVIRNPKRKEDGIVEKTIAVMSPVSVKTLKSKPSFAKATAGEEIWKQEIWVMFQKKNKNSKLNKNNQTKIISAWRYPGMSPAHNPIPEEILRELENIS